MLLMFYLLFTGPQDSEECSLVKNKGQLSITAHPGGSVLLPCYCTDLLTKPDTFAWKRHKNKSGKYEAVKTNNVEYKDRAQLFNSHSPGNLSLLISHLRQRDQGRYRCDAKDKGYTDVRLVIEDHRHRTQTPSNPTPTAGGTGQTRLTSSSTASSLSPDGTSPPQMSSMYFLIFIPVLLLLGLGGVFYWKCREQREKQVDSGEDPVTYTTVVHSNTTTTDVIGSGDRTEYTSIRMK
ncbi:uncharacterized protein [Hoplias malabaricus]|uniref:uncharacterized protein isoform X2 n=1 Tax=Hoplias malabaricus TaxID=27720 RepID=UPI0034625D3B